MSLIVCRPSFVDVRAVLPCPVEGRRRRVIVTVSTYANEQVQCCGCGATYEQVNPLQPARLLQRPTPDRAARAKERWKDARPWREAKKAIDSMLKEVLADE